MARTKQTARMSSASNWATAPTSFVCTGDYVDVGDAATAVESGVTIGTVVIMGLAIVAGYFLFLKK